MILRPFYYYLLLASLLFISAGGWTGGICFLKDPSGTELRLPAAVLENLPVPNYKLPGLFLIGAMGIFPLVNVYGLWARRRWAWIGCRITGSAVVVWTAAQMVVTNELNPLYVTYGLLGVIMLIVTLAPKN